MNKDTIIKMNEIRNQKGKDLGGEPVAAKAEPHISAKLDDATLEMFDAFRQLYDALDKVNHFIKKQPASVILTHWRFITWVLDDHVERIEDLLDYVNESKETK